MPSNVFEVMKQLQQLGLNVSPVTFALRATNQALQQQTSEPKTWADNLEDKMRQSFTKTVAQQYSMTPAQQAMMNSPNFAQNQNTNQSKQNWLLNVTSRMLAIAQFENLENLMNEINDTMRAVPKHISRGDDPRLDGDAVAGRNAAGYNIASLDTDGSGDISQGEMDAVEGFLVTKEKQHTITPSPAPAAVHESTAQEIVEEKIRLIKMTQLIVKQMGLSPELGAAATTQSASSPNAATNAAKPKSSLPTPFPTSPKLTPPGTDKA